MNTNSWYVHILHGIMMVKYKIKPKINNKAIYACINVVNDLTNNKPIINYNNQSFVWNSFIFRVILSLI